MQFKHGQRVTCTIQGIEIKDAKISIDSDGTPYICQNEKNGAIADNKLGYRYSWSLYKDFTNEFVTNLQPFEHSFDYPKLGDVYIDADGDEREVLGVSGRVIHISSYDDKNYFCGSYTKEQLIKYGYTIKKPEPETVEVTLEEIAKLKGVPVEKIKIKE